jgi:hypothetical protein
MRVPADGSGPALELSPWDQAWSSDLTLVEGQPVVLLGRKRLLRVGSVGEEPAPPVALDIGREGQFYFSLSPPLPGGRGVPIGFEQLSGRSWRRGSALVDPRSGRGALILEDGFWPRFVPPDRLLFSRGTTLLGARIDLATGRLQGAPVALLDGLRIKEEWEGGVFSLADDGTLVYAAGGSVGTQRTFAILDPASGAVEPWGDEARQFDAMVKPVTYGGSVYTSLSDASGRLEVWRVPRTGPMQPVVAMADGDAGYPTLSPDGRQVAFVRFTGALDGSSILVAPVDGSAAPREVLRTDAFEWPGVWAPDGRRLLVERYEAGQRSLRELTLGSGEAPRTLAAKAGQGAISPDGRWLAFFSYESGRAEVYLAAYPSAGAIGERLAVTRHGGRAPSWSGDGRTIYFSDLEGHLLAAAVGAGGAPEEPRIVGDAETLRAGEFTVLPDGRLLFVQRGPRESEIRRFDVILHFDRMLAERVP